MKLTTLALGALLVPATSLATFIDLATGLNAGGSLLTAGGQEDGHWLVINANNYSNPPHAVSVFSGDADWYTFWLANGPKSNWIAASNTNGNNGAFTAFRTFTLTASEAATAHFNNAAWALDDSGTLSLNGHLEGSLGSGAWGALTPVSISPSHFVAGVNVLQISITNADNFLEAVRFEGTVTPEPATMTALAVCLVGLGARRRRVR